MLGGAQNLMCHKFVFVCSPVPPLDKDCFAPLAINSISDILLCEFSKAHSACDTELSVLFAIVTQSMRCMRVTVLFQQSYGITGTSGSPNVVRKPGRISRRISIAVAI